MVTCKNCKEEIIGEINEVRRPGTPDTNPVYDEYHHTPDCHWLEMMTERSKVMTEFTGTIQDPFNLEEKEFEDDCGICP